ncbi:MAG: hypothetical protein E7266_00420 [Lachnospiraceae bacterium]|nr:hypothetical protein [Lachnospiraceae bacterium]
MNYIGTWEFHSVGTLNENDEMVYMGAEEYLKSPMPYVDETDPEAVEDEIKERKRTIGGKIALCEEGELYMLQPLPEGVSQEQVDVAVKAGHIKLYDGMMTDDPMRWEERDGEVWLEVGMGMSDDGWVKLSDEEGFLNFMNIRYTKSE